MSYITIDDQQARVIRESTGEIEVRDRDGNRLGFVSRGFSSNEVAEAKRLFVSQGPWLTTEETLNRLGFLEAK